MKNFEKYKTVEECNKAHRDWCHSHTGPNGVCTNPYEDIRGNCIKCSMKWMLLEADEEERPMNCPFCGKECSSSVCREDNCGVVACNYCGYRSSHTATREGAILNHNRICRAVAAYKEIEVK